MGFDINELTDSTVKSTESSINFNNVLGDTFSSGAFNQAIKDMTRGVNQSMNQFPDAFELLGDLSSANSNQKSSGAFGAINDMVKDVTSTLTDSIGNTGSVNDTNGIMGVIGGALKSIDNSISSVVSSNETANPFADIVSSAGDLTPMVSKVADSLQNFDVPAINAPDAQEQIQAIDSAANALTSWQNSAQDLLKNVGTNL